MQLIKMTEEHMKETALDHFVRHQEVFQCWRRVAGKWALVPVRFTEDWSRDQLRDMANQLRQLLHHGYGFLAIEQDAIIGFIAVDDIKIGAHGEYNQVHEFYVDAAFRGQGVGRRLFQLAVAEGIKRGIGKFYLSTHSSRESQAVYQKLGCKHATWLYPEQVALEPYDVQLEYDLGSIHGL